MATLEFSHVSKSYAGKPALDDVSLKLAEDSLTVVCGPPQSGKSVLLRILVGLEAADGGTIHLDGRRLDDMPAGDRPIGYVPQSFALFPHMSVYDNVAYPMQLHGASREAVRRRVDEVAGLVNIHHLLDHRPDQLSGGEKQRTAVARGLLKDAALFVLDDPLVGLDFKLRERLMDDLRDMRRELGITFLYVTGDPVEAMTMADDLVVLDRGRIVEHRDVFSIYDDPHNLRAAELIGFPPCNLVSGTLSDSRCHTPLLECALDTAGDVAANGDIVAALRPEDVRLTGGDTHGAGILGDVRLVEDLGAERVIYLEAGAVPLTAVLRSDEGEPPAEGETVAIDIRAERLMIFDAGSGRRLGRGKEASHA